MTYAIFCSTLLTVVGGNVVFTSSTAVSEIGPACFFCFNRGELSMATGTVKWFSNAKGYGFIAPDQGGDDIFAHFSSISMEGYKSLRQGQKVEYEVSQGPKGSLASAVTLDGDPEPSEGNDK